MKVGTLVRVGERIGTVVFHGLVGYGIKWGIHEVTEEDMRGTYGDLFEADIEDFPWEPDALLREDCEALREMGWVCVGEDYEVLDESL